MAWTGRENQVMLNLLAELVERGNKLTDGTFSKALIESNVLPKFNDICCSNKKFEHYKARWKTWKKTYSTIAGMLNSGSGFGWNADTERVTADDEVWDGYIKYFEVQNFDTSSDDEKMMIMAATGASIVAYNIIINSKVPRQNISIEGPLYMRRALSEDHPEDFRSRYRMTPIAFMKLCKILRSKSLLKDTRVVPIEEQLGMFLLTIGQNQRYSWIINSHFNKVLDAIVMLNDEYMSSISTATPLNIQSSHRYYPYFKDCIEAIDGTYIPAVVYGDDSIRFRNRHGKLSQNGLAACTFNLEFIYILGGWEGSANDARVLKDALNKPNGLKVPQGRYYLVDAGYPNRPGFLAPYRGTRYHLQEYGNNLPQNPKELFNLRHASLRNVIERIFGILKSRFVILQTPPPFSYPVQVKIVLACCILHNYLRKECPSDEFTIEEQSQQPFDFYEDEFDGDVESGTAQSQAEQRLRADQFRDEMANQMWEDSCNNI
ncbi:hypothetical protein H6P81_012708 [Aristolochia fimbriata]|uniref:DDE Tnp4 domain-containing protein n=1 Tax=Aristolochia fimbriata TaxID=158543 RepID=A0AAV7ECJ5_ARIFI|nr:hypothetical protein H6P81_012708 [Aristolochia fimbriata]